MRISTRALRPNDAREDAIKKYETYQEISADMSTEQTYLRAVGRDEVIGSIRQSLLEMNNNRLAAYYRVRVGRSV